jgi:glycosyltransferase involved in cell wall biosynthesis
MKLSIILATRNRKNFLPTCLESYSKLRFEKELIVVDGLSTDGSIEILKNYATTLVSEKDSSVYEAWNKAISLASGDWILFLNSDDSLISENIESILRKVPANHIGIVQFGVTIAGMHMSKVTKRSPKLSFREIISEPCFFNGYMFHRNVFKTVGLFNQDFGMCSDQEFLWRCILKNVPVISFKIDGYNYLVHEGSLTLQAPGSLFREELEIAKRFLESSKERPSVKYAKRWINWELISTSHRSSFVRVFVRISNYKTSQQQIYSIIRKISRSFHQ